jgi:hypothetical protein
MCSECEPRTFIVISKSGCNIYVCACMGVLCVYMCTCTYVCLHICIYVCVYVCMYYVSTYVCSMYVQIPVAVRSKAWVCSRLLAGTAGSNPAGGMNVCVFRVLCIAR